MISGDRLRWERLLLLVVPLVVVSCSKKQHISMTDKAEFKKSIKQALASGEYRELQHHKDDSLAVAAGFAELEMSIVSNGSDSTIQAVRSMEDFMHLLGNRIGKESIPEWWKMSFRDFEIGKSGGLYFSDDHFPEYRRDYVIESKNGRSIAIVNDTNIRISFSSYEGIALLKTKDAVFAAPYSFQGVPFDITRHERSTGSKVWTSQIWANYGWHLVNVPPFTQFVEIVQRDKNLLVFGISPEGAFIERVSIHDGAATFRFSTATLADQ